MNQSDFNQVRKIIDLIHNGDEMATTTVIDFIEHATARQLMDILNVFEGLPHKPGKEWAAFARTALQIRLTEDATSNTDKLLKQTEKLTNHTEVMIIESQKLGRLTWALIFLTVGLLVLTTGLLYIDWHREH